MGKRGSRIVLLAGLTALLGGGVARAGEVVVMDQPDGHESTLYLQGDRLRIQDFGDMGPDGAVIFDARTRQVVFVYDDAQAFFDRGKAMRKAPPAIARFIAMAVRSFPTPRSVDVHYIPLREKRTVNGFACEMYDEFSDGRVTKESCYAPWGPNLGPPKDWELQSALVDALAASLFTKKEAARLSPKTTGDRHPPGLAIWKQKINPDKTRGEVSQIKSIKVEDLPTAIFSVPPTYHEVDEPLDPPRDGAARQRALRLARISPRGDGPRDEGPHLGTRLTGLIVVLLLVVMTFGLLVHAFLVHVAAGIVLDSPRFINAVAATTVVWIVGVPLELLGIWPPAAFAVALLAAFGGLKLAYQTSAARTLALLFVSTLVALVARFALTFVAGGFTR